MSDARAIIRDTLVVGIVLALTASRYDATEVLATATFAVLRTALQMRYPSQPRWLNGALVGALALAITVRCAHEAFGRVWLTTAASPGEHWEETWARHVAKGPR